MEEEKTVPRWLSALTGVVCAIALVVFVVTLVIRVIAGDAGGMARAMSYYAPADETGLPADEYAAVADMMTGYLTGKRETFAYTLVDTAGEEYEAFNERETAHMADCRGLIRLDKRVCALSLVIAAAALIFAAAKGADWRIFGRGGLIGLAVVGAGALVLVIWALVNF